MEAIEQEADLAGRHLKSMFLEEDEDKPVENLTDPSSVFLGPRWVRVRATPDTAPAPLPVIPHPATANKPSPSSSQLEQLLPMLQSLHHGQYLLMQSDRGHTRIK